MDGKLEDSQVDSKKTEDMIKIFDELSQHEFKLNKTFLSFNFKYYLTEFEQTNLNLSIQMR